MELSVVESKDEKKNRLSALPNPVADGKMRYGKVSSNSNTTGMCMEMEDLICMHLSPGCRITPGVVHPPSGDSKMGCGELTPSPGYQSPSPMPRPKRGNGSCAGVAMTRPCKENVGSRLTAGKRSTSSAFRPRESNHGIGCANTLGTSIPTKIGCLYFSSNSSPCRHAADISRNRVRGAEYGEQCTY